MFTTLIIAIGILAVLALGYTALSGPSASRAYKRRLELLRERHGDAVTASAQAQIRKLFASRNAKVDDALSSLVPRPALLRRRLEQTGKDIGLPKYVAIMGGLLAVTTALLLAKGAPILLALLLGVLVGVGIPHFVISFLIKKRVAKFNSNFPDAIELMVRGLRSGLPITETLGIVATEIGGPVGL
jgi:tight adherence protein B